MATQNDGIIYEQNVIKISSSTNSKSAAGSLAMVLKDWGFAELIAIGPAAVNQGLKAVAIARGHVAPLGMDLCLIPSFETTYIDGNEKTRMRMRVEPR